MSDDVDARLAAVFLASLPSRDPGRSVLLAVSGGPDSTALMSIAAAHPGAAALHVATVDHGLRPGSDAEAVAVRAMADTFSLPHRVLCWTTPRRDGGIQAAARAARYRLLAAHAAEIGADLVVTGHTADDQAETILMRLLAGSGPAGLAGMRAERSLGPGLRLVRPFLAVRKTDLVAYCERHRLPILRDPSNEQDRYTRVRLRRLLPSLGREGLTVERLCRLGERAARDEAALSQIADAVFASVRRPTSAGLALDGRRLLSEPAAIALRVVDRAIDAIRPPVVAPVARRLERTERLVVESLLPALETGMRLRKTLREVMIETDRGGDVLLAPAPARRRAAMHGGALAAGRSDLLGKEKDAAYIGGERVE